MRTKVLPIIVLVLVLAAGAAGFFWTKNKITKGKAEVKGEATSEPTPVPSVQPTPNYPVVIGNFLVTEKEICVQEGKPSVYFFGSSSCPHCMWEKPIIEKVAKEFAGKIDFHENIDNQTNMDVFQKYSNINPGYVPFLVFGCKYARVGSGESLGKDEAESKKLEEETLTVILCKLTEGKPETVCAPVKDKTSAVN